MGQGFLSKKSQTSIRFCCFLCSVKRAASGPMMRLDISPLIHYGLSCVCVLTWPSPTPCPRVCLHDFFSILFFFHTWLSRPIHPRVNLTATPASPPLKQKGTRTHACSCWIGGGRRGWDRRQSSCPSRRCLFISCACGRFDISLKVIRH